MAKLFEAKETTARMDVRDIVKMNKDKIEEIAKGSGKVFGVVFDNGRNSKIGKPYFDIITDKSRISVLVDPETGELGSVFRDTMLIKP